MYFKFLHLFFLTLLILDIFPATPVFLKIYLDDPPPPSYFPPVNNVSWTNVDLMLDRVCSGYSSSANLSIA